MHVVDRVLFPPTVGDVVQTLKVGVFLVKQIYFMLFSGRP